MTRLYIRDLEQFQDLSRAEKRQVFGGTSAPLVGVDRRRKIADFNNPWPRDRLFNDDQLYDSELGVQFVRLY